MRIAMWAAVAAVGFSVGCGGSDASKPAASAPAANGAAAAGEIPSDPIGRVAYDFLEAVRIGQGEAAATKFLTPLALQQIQQQDLNIAPPGSPTARFVVNHVEMLENGDHAVVQSTWTDVDADGKQYQEPIYCALRICDGQWRIHGMAQEMGQDEQGNNLPPMVIDFESLDAMLEAEQKELDQMSPANVPADQLAAPGGQTAPAGTQPAAEVAADPFNAATQR